MNAGQKRDHDLARCAVNPLDVNGWKGAPLGDDVSL